MSELAVLVLAIIWLSILTVVVLLLVRQVALLSVQLSFAGPVSSFADDGPPIGSAVPDDLLELMRDGSGSVLALSASCIPCRELVGNLHRRKLKTPVVAVIEGDIALARALATELPRGALPVLGSGASAILQTLRIESRPFVIGVWNGNVTRKAYVRSDQDFLAFVTAESNGAVNGENRVSERGAYVT